jgi:transposase
VLKSFPTCPVAEVGRTLHAWKEQFLAYFTTGRTSNGTEAINGIIESTAASPAAPATHITTGYG